MISAPSRRLPLSGNNLCWLLLALFCVTLWSCTASRTTGKTPSTTHRPDDKSHENEVRVYDPATGTYKWVPKDMVKVDTVKMKEDDTPPLVTDEDEVSDKPDTKKRQYSISMLLPFSSASQYDVMNNDAKLGRFVQYYAGVQLAVEEVDPFGRDFLIHAFDAEGLTQADHLMARDPNLAKADVIIGPYEKDGLEKIAEYGLNKEKFVISPWLPAFSTQTENPYFIQAVPGLGAHATAITNFLSQSVPFKKIYLVARDVPAEINRLLLFKKDPGLDVEDLIIKDKTPELMNTDLKSKLVPEGSVFILPYYAKADESFVNSFLRKLHAEKELEDVTVVGLPQWIGFSNLNSNYMENLSVHLSISTFLDVDHPQYKSFRGRFFDRYHTDPDLQAFLGYDLMKWIASTVKKGGKEAFISPDAQWSQGIASGFTIQPVFKAGDAKDVEMHTPLYYENVYIRIIKYNELDFRLLK
jgi:hypothetical protein